MIRKLTWVVACIAVAQELTVQPPVLGYLHDDGTSAVRAIQGLPGAAVLASSGIEGVQAAFTCGGGGFGVISRADGNFAFLGSLVGTYSVFAISANDPRLLTACGDQSAVVLSGDRIYVIRRSAELVVVEPLTINFPVTSIHALDYRETARELYFTAATGDSASGVYLYSVRENTLSRIVALERPGQIALFQEAVYVVDEATMDLWRADLRAGGWAATRFINSPEGSRIAGIASSLDGQRLFIADSGLNRVAVYDSSGSITETLPIQVPVNALRRISQQALLISYERGEPIYLLKDSDPPAVFFVPSGSRGGSNQ